MCEASPESAGVTPLPVPPGVARLVLLGGTFDPPHRAHTELGSLARDRVADPDAWLVVVPAARSPFKASEPTSDADRLEMLRRAVAPLPRACIWTDEIDRARGAEPSYWIDTLRRLGRLRPDASVWFVIGADQAAELHRWRQAREILTLARPIILPRGAFASPEALAVRLRDTGAWTEAEVRGLCDAMLGLAPRAGSATEARKLLATMGPDAPELRELLAPEVLDLIRERGLYVPAH